MGARASGAWRARAAHPLPASHRPRTRKVARSAVAHPSLTRRSLTSLNLNPNPNPTIPQDAGEIAHARDTLSAACASADAAGAAHARDTLASSVAAAINAARCVAAGPAAGVVGAEDLVQAHLDAADGVAKGAEGGAEVGEVMRVAAAGARIAAAAAVGDSDVASKSARYILDACSNRTPTPFGSSSEREGGGDAVDVPPGLERAVPSSVSRSSSEALIESALRAANEPHGFAVAHAFKQCAQWIALAATCDDDDADAVEGAQSRSSFSGPPATLARADAMYALAEEISAAARSSGEIAAATSALYADVVYADVKLGRAQLALRLATSLAARLRKVEGESESARSSARGGAAGDGDPVGGDSEASESVEETRRGYDELRDALAAAESSAAAALTACEALGGSSGHRSEGEGGAPESGPDARVALAAAVSGDVYVAKAVVAARAPGRGGVGDGAGVMFAEGLYRNALRLMGTPRPPTATADDADAAAGGAAPAHLRLSAAMIHARYAAILRASGGRREREAEAWAAAAAREWRAPGDGDKDDARAVAWAAKSIGSVGEGGEKACAHDLTLMMPVTLHNTRCSPRATGGG